MKSFVLVGAPNSGKTTFYNWITGSNFKTVNYPGSTVEYSVGSIANELVKKYLIEPNVIPNDSSHLTKKVMFIDTPGTYSLIPKSPDEEVTYSVLYDLKNENKEKNVILVLDGLHIERSLIMALQIKKAGFPFSIVITMDDLLKKYNKEFDVRKLAQLLNVDVFTFNGQTGAGLKEIVQGLKVYSDSNSNTGASSITGTSSHTGAGASSNLNVGTNSKNEIKKIDWTYLDFQQAKVQLNEILSQIKLNAEKSDFFRLTQKIDGIALGKFGFIVFFLLMSLLFASLFWFSAPFADGIEWGFNYLSEGIDKLLPESLFREFISKGVLSSFAAILVFVPQIFLLFFGLGILESTGYLPRAAALIDHPLRKLGLGGRSFVPLLSGFACAVPALMATRNITSKKERILSLFVIPLMSCSARIPVYGLLITFLIADNVFVAGLMMAGLYMFSLLVGAIAALILSRFIPSSKDQYFLMELPLYRMPRWKLLVKQAFQKTKSYVVRAGPIIFVFAVLIWGSTQFPRTDFKAPALAESYAGQLGQFMEPIFKPMGVDWRVGVGLISAFAAREVFVSSIAVTFKVTEDEDEDKQAQELSEVMKNASFTNGDKIFTVGSVLGLIVFFMIALQCMSTVAVQLKESGSYKFAIGQLVVLNLVAYVLAVLINQTYSFLFK